MEFAALQECQPNLGNYVDICGTIPGPPNVIRWKCDPSRNYTLFFIDGFPLGVTRPTLLAQGILWWQVDIHRCDVDRGRALYEYQPPTVLFGSGKDKFLFLVYEQPRGFVDFSEEAFVPSR